MADKILYPSLSSHSWTESPVITADMLMSDFIAAEYSQTYIYKDTVSSLPYIMQETNGEPEKTASMIQKTLETYFNRYFTGVIVETNVMDNTENDGKDSVSIYLQFTDANGVTHNLNKLMSYSNMKFVSMINLNNS